MDQKNYSMLLLKRERGRVAKNRKYKLCYGTIGKNAIEAEVTKEVEELDMNSATYGRADKWASHGDVTTSLTHYQAHLGFQPCNFTFWH